jgi:hypothetical protein
MPASEYARLATADKAWRQQHARQYTLNELRQRAAGNRTPREAMQDRVFIAVKKGQHQQAIGRVLGQRQLAGGRRHQGVAVA